MNVPETLPDWLADVQDAYQSACMQFRFGLLPISKPTELYKMSAPIAAKRRNITKAGQLKKMAEYVQQDIDTDLENGGDLNDYKFNFVISYIHAHTPAGILPELEADDIMDYINQQWELFEEDLY